jgi:hypothetical protein
MDSMRQAYLQQSNVLRPESRRPAMFCLRTIPAMAHSKANAGLRPQLT